MEEAIAWLSPRKHYGGTILLVIYKFVPLLVINRYVRLVFHARQRKGYLQSPWGDT